MRLPLLFSLLSVLIGIALMLSPAVTSADPAAPATPFAPDAVQTAPPAAVSATQLLAQAQMLAASGHNDQARDVLKRANALEPENLAVLRLLGDVEYRLQNFKAAEAAYKTVLARNPGDKDVHNRLGGVYSAEDRLTDAVTEFRASLPLREGMTNLVQAYAEQGKLGELEQEQSIAVDRDPIDAAAHYNLGFVYYYEHKYNGAMMEFKSALVHNQRMVDAYNMLGATYGELGRYDDAISQYRDAISLNSKYYQSYMNWGVELIKQGNYDEAIAKIQRSLEIAPDYALAYENLGVVFEYRGEFTHAVELYNKAITLNPQERTAYLNLGAIYQSHNLANLAEAAFIKGLAIAPHYADLHYNLGLVYQSEHKLDLAIAQFKIALDEAPDHPYARTALTKAQSQVTH